MNPNRTKFKNGLETANIAIKSVIQGHEGHFRIGNVLNQMTQIFQNGTSFSTQLNTEIGRWDRRYLVDLDPLPEVNPDHYYSWVGPGIHECDPPLTIHTKSEFMDLFEDCCRSYVAALKTPGPFNPHPSDRSEEFAKALAANGMSLAPTIGRP